MNCRREHDSTHNTDSYKNSFFSLQHTISSALPRISRVHTLRVLISTKEAYWKRGGELDVASAPISLWSSSISSPQGMTFWLSVSPEIKGIRCTHATSSYVFLCSWWSHYRMDPSYHYEQVHPSLHLLILLQLLSPLSLPQKQSFKISLNLCLLWQVLLTHIIWPDSILFQFVLHDLIKEEGGEFTPSICNFSVVFNGCHWHPSSMSQFPGATHLSSRYLPLKLLPGKQRLNSLITQILDCPYFLNGTKIQEISPMVKWEKRESVLDFHFPVLSPVLFHGVFPFKLTFNFKNLLHLLRISSKFLPFNLKVESNCWKSST